MFPVGSAFASSFDLFDLPFQLHPVSVFSHPLFTNRANYSVQLPEKESSDKAEKLKQLQRNGKICAVEETNGGGDRCGEKQQNFVDPLNASAIDERTNEHSANTKTLPSVSHLNGVPSDGFGPGPMAILATERLDNTLAERESEQWPLEGLDPQLVGHRSWKVLRQRILDTFSSATDRLSLESSFLRGNEATETQNSAEKRKLRKTISGETEKMRQRKNFAIEKHAQTVAKFNELTQDEWTRKLKELRRILLIKWEEEKRLECIKLTSEVAMLISTNISSAQFYPSQFVHVTDFLDLFGHLVYKRLLHRAAEERRGVGLGALPSHFDTNDVLEETRIKARNWFGKVNETVALLAPRIYLLTALLPCQRFMDPLAAIQENVLELCQSVKQVQHPLISSYLRCYICRVAMRLNAADRAPHWKCLNDWLQTYAQQPTFLLGPAMEWVVQCVAFNAVSYSDLHPLWEYCRLPERRAVVLLPMLNALPRLYLGEHALEACRIVTGSEMVSGEELCAFGANLLETEVPVHSRKSILKAVWKCVMRLASLKHYMDCCECWVEFAARHFGTNEVNVMLDNMLTKLNQQQQLKDKYGFYQPQLLAVLRKVFTHSRDVATLFGMDVFIKFVDTFNAGPIREEVFLIILRALVAKHSVASFTSIDLAYQVLSTCQSLHDCVEPTSSDDRVHSVVGLISASLDRVDLSADPDQCLDFLVSCRANLANIDGLQKYVLCRVQAFTLHIVRSVRFSNSRAAFLQGCLANLFISTPSLADPLDQIHFGIRSTQIALAALAFFQVDSFVAFVLDTFDGLSLSPTLHTHILQLGTDFLATLVHIPLEQQHQSEEEEEDEQTEESRRLPLKHFRRFLHFVLRFWHSVSPSFAPSPPLSHHSLNLPLSTQFDFVRLLIRCLQYLCVVWPTVHRTFPLSAADQSPLIEDEEIAQQLMQQQQNQLQDDEDEAEQNQFNVAHLRNICTQCAEKIADALKPFLVNENASDEMCLAGVELLELLAQFGPTDATEGHGDASTDVLPGALLTLAKTIYKQCKRKPELRKRIQRMANR